MGPKVVSGNNTHRDCHPSFYEDNYRDYYLSLLPVFVPLTHFTISNAYSWRDSILSPKTLYSLLEVYETLKATHLKKGLKN